MNKRLLLKVFVIFLTAFSSISILAKELESSVVSLFISHSGDLLVTNPFFEIVDQGEHILLPLTSFANYLEVNLEYNNAEQLIMIKYQDSSVIISTKNNLYINHPEWSFMPPLTLDGTLYVTPLIFEYLTAATIEWKPSFQEVSVTLSQKPGWLDENTNESDNKSKKTNQTNTSEDKIVASTQNGINLIRYQLNSNFILPQKTADLDLNWQIYGRIKDFSLAAVINNHFTTLNGLETHLKMLRAKYENAGHLLIFGDEESIWIDSLYKKYIRGATYTYSQGPLSNTTAYKNFSGAVAPGSFVSIYVNGKLIQSLEPAATKEGLFSFSAVPLLRSQLNLIRIVIQEPSGTFRELNYQIVGEARILLPGVFALQSALGLYRRPTYPEFEGVMSGFSLRKGGNNYSIWVDGIYYKKFETPVAENSYRLSVYFQPLNNVILDANTYLTPNDQENNLNGSFGLKVYLPNLISSANIYRVSSAVNKVFPQNIGEGTSFSLVYLPFTDWQFELYKVNSYIKNIELKHDRLTFSLTKTLETPSRSQVTLTYFNDFLENNRLNSLLNTNGLQWKYRERTTTTQLDRSFSYKQNDLSETYLNNQSQELEVSASGTEILGKNGLVSHSVLYQNQMESGKLKKQCLNITGTVKGTVDNITAFLSLSSLHNTPENSNKLEQEDLRLRFLFDQVINKKFKLSTNTIRTWKKDHTNDTFITELSLNYTNGQKVLQNNLEYLINLSETNRHTISYGIELKNTLSNGLCLIPKFKITAKYPANFISYLIGLELNQSLGLASKRVDFFSYSDQAPKAYLTGRVFLDANNNNILDPGEFVVSDIPVRLDNNIVDTDETGKYRFEDLEPGEYILGFDEYSLPAEYTQDFKPKLVVIKEYESIQIDLPLSMLGSISGTVFLDINENNIFDDEDMPISLATVVLNDNLKTLTNNSGHFVFEHIKLGTITLSIEPQSLPPQTVLFEPLVITLNSEQTDFEILLPVRLITKPLN